MPEKTAQWPEEIWLFGDEGHPWNLWRDHDPAGQQGPTGERFVSRHYVPRSRVAELEEAIRETLCDDAPCSRCHHLRAALKAEGE